MLKAVHISRDDITQAKVVVSKCAPLGVNSVRLKVESFAVTANNVTYAVAGEIMGYWNFFPAPTGKGIVPMWGHAVVTASNHDQIAVGERIYGYLPMATHLDVLPGKVRAGGFVDKAEHRQPMAAIYNQYALLDADPEHAPAHESERMIFGPLFKTGFLIESMFRSENWYGADAAVVTSASSKTAMAFASVAREKSPGIRRVGLTSPANVAFVKESRLYDSVFPYDEVGALEKGSTVLIDFAGNAKLMRGLHEHLDDALRYSCLVGATHLGERGGGKRELPGPEPILFFAPTYAAAAIERMGAKQFGTEIAASFQTFLNEMKGAVAIETRSGIESARDTYGQMAAGEVDPAKGIIIQLQP